jgi:hypothetical protein
VHSTTTAKRRIRHELPFLLAANATGTLDRLALPAAPDLDRLHRLHLLQRHKHIAQQIEHAV